MSSVTLIAVPGVPDIQPGDDLPTIIADAIAPLRPVDGDVLCVAQKIVSKAEGCLIALTTVTPSEQALELARELDKDPREVQVVLDESRRIVRKFKNPGAREGTLICEHRLGFVSANAAVDKSNLGLEDAVLTLPRDPDASCRALAARLAERFGATVGVVITDTFGRPWRLGQVNVAIGLAGVPATLREQGNTDAWGRVLRVTEPALADEIAAATGLVVRKNARTPLVLVRGLDWARTDSRATDIIRTEQEDMFR